MAIPVLEAVTHNLSQMAKNWVLFTVLGLVLWVMFNAKDGSQREPPQSGLRAW